MDFLGLNGYYSEEELEDAIVTQLESFILELGQGFAFLERQKRFTVDGTDYYLDLLFYHRRLKCRCNGQKIGGLCKVKMHIFHESL